ncbi:MAG: ABC transporter ATP-binding protein [Rhodocyclaceae bacterium]|nr:MAG: ABC transporter ATP-binding protein [Rhodocyclaceae bacterium]
MSEAILRAERLTKRFGGLTAVNEVSLELHVGQVHAVIGPNGAGKSTLTNLISGELPPSGGAIHFRDETQFIHDLAGLKSDRIARLGIGRSYQKTNIFLPFSVFENCRLAAQSRQPRAWRIFRGADGYADVNAIAERSLQAAGLGARSGMTAAALSHGEQRQLEIAMCLATQPRVLLLDEPLAGMGSQESQRIIELIRQLTPAHAIMLIEHDMDAVFAVAHRLTVMVNGEVIESGAPAEIRASLKVQQAYLGDAHGGTDD